MGNDTEGRMIQINKPSPPAVVAELHPLVSGAHEFKVADIATNTVALERVKRLRAGEKEIAAYFEDARKATDAAKKEVLAARDGLMGPLREARTIYDRKADEYERAEREKAEVESRRLQAEAKRQEEERQLQDAIDAEEAGDDEAAAAIMDEPTDVPVVAVVPQVAKVEGVSKRVLWSAQVTDLRALAEYVVKHPEWITLIVANQTNLNRLAVSQHEALNIPGVIAISKTSRATR